MGFVRIGVCHHVDQKTSFTRNFIVNSSGLSPIPSYIEKGFLPSEDEPEAHERSHEDLLKRDEEVKNSFRHQTMEMLLLDAKLCEQEPITNCQPVTQTPHELHEEILIDLNKVYPIQKAVWPHISNNRSIILIGMHSNYYPHLLYLPAICDQIKVMILLKLFLECFTIQAISVEHFNFRWMKTRTKVAPKLLF